MKPRCFQGLIAVLALAIASWLVTLPAYAGTNNWTWNGAAMPWSPSCNGSTSIGQLKACHATFATNHGANPQCGPYTAVLYAGPTFDNGSGEWAVVIRSDNHGSDLGGNGIPDDCLGTPNAIYSSFGFYAECATGYAWNGTYGGCAPNCVGPQILNTDTGTCTFPTPRHRPKGCLCKGNPADVTSGNKIQREVDYTSATGTLSFTRTYNGLSFHPAKQGPYGSPLGTGWFASYLQYLSAPSGLSSATVNAVRPGGDVIAFTATSPGSTSTEYEFDGELEERLVVVLNGSGVFIGWRYITADDDQELYDTNGRLVSIQSRTGVTQTLTYGANSRVESVEDDFGHELGFAWDTETPPRLTSVTLPGSSGEIEFTYGANNNLTLVTYPDTTTREYLYELTGAGQKNLLTGIEDESSTRYVTWGYGTGNVVTSSEHAGGVDSYSITYNTDGTRVVVDPLGTSRTYTTEVVAGQRRYTDSDLLCQGCGEYASATFDAFGNFESKTDFNDIETRFTYDTARTLETSRIEAYGTANERTIETDWHSTYRLPTLITEPGRETALDYDTDGNLLELEVTDTGTSEARVTTWTYDGYGRVLTADGPRTDVDDETTYTYYTCGTGYECGQLETVTDALDHVTTFDSYNAHGQPLEITDPNGVLTTLTYDLRQRLTSRTVAGEETAFEYWPTGLLKKVTLPDSSFVLYTYDDAHRLTRIDDSADNYIVYTLDDKGNRTAEDVHDSTTALRRTQARVFNDLNQLWKTLTAAATTEQTTELGYDDNGNQTTVDAPLGRSTVNAFDELNRLIESTDPGTGVTEIAYDDRDNVTSVTDPLSNVTSYTYSGFDDLLTQTSPDTGLTTNTYDSGGNLATSTDARDAVAAYEYDELNRVTSVEYSLSSTPDQTIAFTYDAGTYGKGRLTGASDANHSLEWEYDALGRVTSKTQTVGAVEKTVEYEYTDGNLTTLTTPSGQTVVYGYGDGRITSITVNGTTLLSGATYEPFGPVNGWTWGNSTTMSRTFDTDGNVTAIASSFSKTFDYDDAFRITGITDTVTSANSYAYGYDDLDRLTSAVKTGTTRGWTYDDNGNRLSETGASASTYTIASTSNHVSSISGGISRSYSYDDAGNTLTYSGFTATYNHRGRMATVNNGSTTASFTYNALGELVKRAGGAPGTVHYVYDEAGHLLGEYDATGALIEETVWLGDTPVATLRPGTPVGVFYVHTDQLNTPRKVTRPSDNQARWTWESDPFGAALPNENPASLGTFQYNLRFPGQIYDAHTGLNYNYLRDYDAATGRYVESDPIGLEGGVNTYAYVQGDPVSRADRLGLRVDWGGYVFHNSMTTGNLEMLNWLVVLSGVPDDCFVIRVTGGDRYRDPTNPNIHRSSTDHSIVDDSSSTSPHLVENGARAVDFNLDSINDPCRCSSGPQATNNLIDALLPFTGFSSANTSRDYPNAPHTHIALPNTRAYRYRP
jgi:RHS repeat-associated protein